MKEFNANEARIEKYFLLEMMDEYVADYEGDRVVNPASAYRIDHSFINDIPKAVTEKDKRQYFHSKYAFLSTTAFCPEFVELGGMFFPTAEHAYWACRCKYKADQLKLTAQPDPNGPSVSAIPAHKVKEIARKFVARNGWNDEQRIKAMRAVTYAKFTQNEELRDKLLMYVKDFTPVNLNYWGDKFWGVCDEVEVVKDEVTGCPVIDEKTGQEKKVTVRRGQNHLGKIIAEVRDEIRDMSYSKRVQEYVGLGSKRDEDDENSDNYESNIVKSEDGWVANRPDKGMIPRTLEDSIIDALEEIIVATKVAEPKQEKPSSKPAKYDSSKDIFGDDVDVERKDIRSKLYKGKSNHYILFTSLRRSDNNLISVAGNFKGNTSAEELENIRLKIANSFC